MSSRAKSSNSCPADFPGSCELMLPFTGTSSDNSVLLVGIETLSDGSTLPLFYRTKPKECIFIYQSQISYEHLHSLNPRTLNPECHKLRTLRNYGNLCICLTPRNPVLHSLYKVLPFLAIFIMLWFRNPKHQRREKEVLGN